MAEITIGNFTYTIDEFGNINKRRGGGFKKAFIDEYGYLKVTLIQKGICYNRTVHQLVYEAFKGKIPSGMTIDHIDGDKLNNHIDNLQVLSRTDNTVKANGKFWIVTKPDGTEINVFNVERFCRDNKLHPSHIKTHSYKGWRARRDD